MVNKILPFDVIKFMKMKLTYAEVKKFIKLKQKLIIRLCILSVSGVMLMVLRFSVMGFKPPTFQSVDNPASFMDNAFLRILNYSYIYCLNVWLLICPAWLCFDWSMGCVPLITTYDYRIFCVIIFWLILGTMIVHIFICCDDLFLR